MDIATGAMNTLLPKLGKLVVGEYRLQKGVKGEIEELEKELSGMNLALRKVAKVPVDQLDEQVKDWATDVRELSYDIEDAVDTFMLQAKVYGHTEPFSFKGLIGMASSLYMRAKTNHKIHNVVKDIMDQVKKVAARRDRYKVDQVAASSSTSTVDPRLEGMYRKSTELVGIEEPKNKLVKIVMDENSSSLQRPKILSIVGFGGLGKTTLANALCQDLKGKFDCHVFVSVSQNPDLKRIFKNILLQLDDKKYGNIDEAWEINQLIDKIIEFLKNRRCLCVIHDLWEQTAWDDAIKLAFKDGNNGSKIIITTRNKGVAERVGGAVYELKPLSDDDSKLLFHKRIFNIEDGCPPSLREVTRKILKKCGGVPLAIITTASLLASKPLNSVEWKKGNSSLGSGLERSPDMDKMRKILILSYNNLPFYLKTCLLSLSKYSEDEVIRKDVLIWSWIAEGFISKETQLPGRSLQEIGESYFSELINRSLIQRVDIRMYFLVEDGDVHYCQVHDMVLELINQLSTEECFVTTLRLSDDQQATTHTSVVQERKFRWLSLHSSNRSYASPEARGQLCKVRSLTIFGKFKSIPPLSSLHVLRVLQLEDCAGLDNNHLNGLGELRHLTFLRLQGLKVTELPDSIGKLESLETLDIRGAWPSVILLPVSFGKLGRLVRLLADRVELSDSVTTMGNMKSVQELVGIRLCKLSELKVLTLDINGKPRDSTSTSNEWILMCLQMCPSLQVLGLRPYGLDYSLDFIAQVPSGLQKFMCEGFFKEAFPRWINPSLSYLTILSIGLAVLVPVLPENLEKLAELPSLRSISIHLLVAPPMQEILTVPTSASAFPCLTDLQLHCALMFLKFDYGAMRKLQRLTLMFDGRCTNQHFAYNNFGYGLDNLLSVHHVVIIQLLHKYPEVEDAIRKEISANPNYPSLDISTLSIHQ